MRNRIQHILKYFKKPINILTSHVKLSKSIKNDVLRMYNYTCAGNIPGHPCEYNVREALEVDHIVPRAILCIHKKYNLQVLCSNCHSLKTTYYDIDLIRKFKEGNLSLKKIKKHVTTFI
jgi:5-methylcytosine-specific restriction endonuclease McrA